MRDRAINICIWCAALVYLGHRLHEEVELVARLGTGLCCVLVTLVILALALDHPRVNLRKPD